MMNRASIEVRRASLEGIIEGGAGEVKTAPRINMEIASRIKRMRPTSWVVLGVTAVYIVSLYLGTSLFFNFKRGGTGLFERPAIVEEYKPTSQPILTELPNVVSLEKPYVSLEDVYSMVFSRATLYDGSHAEVVKTINSITKKSGGRILVARVYDFDNTLAVQYEGESSPSTFLVDDENFVDGEKVIDDMLSKSEGYRHESIDARPEDFIYALEQKGLSVLDYANLINKYCKEKMDPEELAEKIKGAALINLVPNNGRYPLLNIVGPSADEVYTFYAKDTKSMTALLDAANVPAR